MRPSLDNGDIRSASSRRAVKPVGPLLSLPGSSGDPARRAYRACRLDNAVLLAFGQMAHHWGNGRFRWRDVLALLGVSSRLSKADGSATSFAMASNGTSKRWRGCVFRPFRPAVPKEADHSFRRCRAIGAKRRCQPASGRVDWGFRSGVEAAFLRIEGPFGVRRWAPCFRRISFARFTPPLLALEFLQTSAVVRCEPGPLALVLLRAANAVADVSPEQPNFSAMGWMATHCKGRSCAHAPTPFAQPATHLRRMFCRFRPRPSLSSVGASDNPGGIHRIPVKGRISH